jgi:hypothetical protein
MNNQKGTPIPVSDIKQDNSPAISSGPKASPFPKKKQPSRQRFRKVECKYSAPQPWRKATFAPNDVRFQSTDIRVDSKGVFHPAKICRLGSQLGNGIMIRPPAQALPQPAAAPPPKQNNNKKKKPGKGKRPTTGTLVTDAEAKDLFKCLLTYDDYAGAGPDFPGANFIMMKGGIRGDHPDISAQRVLWYSYALQKLMKAQKLVPNFTGPYMTVAFIGGSVCLANQLLEFHWKARWAMINGKQTFAVDAKGNGNDAVIKEFYRITGALTISEILVINPCFEAVDNHVAEKCYDNGVASVSMHKQTFLNNDSAYDAALFTHSLYYMQGADFDKIRRLTVNNVVIFSVHHPLYRLVNGREYQTDTVKATVEQGRAEMTVAGQNYLSADLSFMRYSGLRLAMGNLTWSSLRLHTKQFLELIRFNYAVDSEPVPVRLGALVPIYAPVTSNLLHYLYPFINVLPYQSFWAQRLLSKRLIWVPEDSLNETRQRFVASNASFISINQHALRLSHEGCKADEATAIVTHCILNQDISIPTALTAMLPWSSASRAVYHNTYKDQPHPFAVLKRAAIALALLFAVWKSRTIIRWTLQFSVNVLRRLRVFDACKYLFKKVSTAHSIFPRMNVLEGIGSALPFARHASKVLLPATAALLGCLGFTSGAVSLPSGALTPPMHAFDLSMDACWGHALQASVVIGEECLKKVSKRVVKYPVASSILSVLDYAGLFRKSGVMHSIKLAPLVFLRCLTHDHLSRMPLYMSIPIHLAMNYAPERLRLAFELLLAFYDQTKRRMATRLDFRGTDFHDYPLSVTAACYKKAIALPRVDFLPKDKGKELDYDMHLVVKKYDDIPAKDNITLTGPYVSYAMVGFPRCTQATLLNALKQRFLWKQPDITDDGMLNEKEHLFFSQFAPLNVDRAAWIAKQKPYVRGYMEKIARDGISYPYTRYTCHTKPDEKAIIAFNGAMIPVNTRVITHPNHHHNWFVGPYIHAAQHAMAQYSRKALVSVEDMPFIMACGFDYFDLGHIISVALARYPYAICIDKSGFDGSVPPEQLYLETRIYKAMGILDEHFFLKLDCQIDRDVSSRKGIKIFDLVGRRNSGDANTTLGNTLICGLTIRRTMDVLGWVGVPMCAGDDGLIFLEKEPDKKSLAAFITHQYETYGYTNKLMYHGYDPAQIDFISARLVPVLRDGAPSYALTPTIGKTLPKLFYSSSNLARVKPVEYRAALALCMMRMYWPHITLHRMFETMVGDATPRVELLSKTIDVGVGNLVRQAEATTATYTWAPPSRIVEFDERRYGFDPMPQLLHSVYTHERAGDMIYPMAIPRCVINRDLEQLVGA